MAEHTAVCRFCGASGIESDDDIAPGVCPECFDKRLAQVMKDLAEHGIRGGAEAALAALRWAGMTKGAAVGYLATLAAMEARIG